MNVYRAVIDTNVLYAGLYSTNGASFRILELIDNGRIKPQLSTTLLFEYEDVLRRNPEILGLTDSDVEATLNGLCNRGEHRRIHFLWRPKLSDMKDDHVLELAIASQGAPIVTHNLRDFPPAAEFNIRVITPAQLLKELQE